MKNFLNRNKIWLALLLVLAVAAVGTVVFLNRDRDLVSKYFALEAAYFNGKLNDWDKLVKEQEAKSQNLSKGPSRSRYDLSLTLKSGEIPGLIPEAVSLLNSSKIILNSRYDKTADLNLATLSLLLEGQNFADVNLLRQGKLVGVQVPILSDLFFVSEGDKLPQVLSSFGIDLPSVTLPEAPVMPKFKTSDFKTIINGYLDYAKEGIGRDNLKMTSVKEDGTVYSLYELKFDEDGFKTFIKETAKLLLSDDRFLALTLDNGNALVEMLRELDNDYIFPFELKECSPDQVLENISTLVDGISFNKGFVMEVKVNKSGDIVSRKGFLSANGPDEPERDINFKINNGDVSLSIVQGEALILLDGIFEGDKKGLTVKTENNLWEDFTLKLDLAHDKSYDDKRKAYTWDIALNMEYNSDIIIGIDLKGEDRFDVPFSMPQLDDSTSLDLNSADPSQVNEILSELQFSALKFLLGNQSLFDIFMGD